VPPRDDPARVARTRRDPARAARTRVDPADADPDAVGQIRRGRSVGPTAWAAGRTRRPAEARPVRRGRPVADRRHRDRPAATGARRDGNGHRRVPGDPPVAAHRDPGLHPVVDRRVAPTAGHHPIRPDRRHGANPAPVVARTLGPARARRHRPRATGGPAPAPSHRDRHVPRPPVVGTRNHAGVPRPGDRLGRRG
jgi:hypothetical protein